MNEYDDILCHIGVQGVSYTKDPKEYMRRWRELNKYLIGRGRSKTGRLANKMRKSSDNYKDQNVFERNQIVLLRRYQYDKNRQDISDRKRKEANAMEKSKRIANMHIEDRKYWQKQARAKRKFHNAINSIKSMASNAVNSVKKGADFINWFLFK